MKLSKEEIREEIKERYIEIYGLLEPNELETHLKSILKQLPEKEEEQAKAILRTFGEWKGIGPLSARELLLRIGQIWAVGEDEIWRKFKAPEEEVKSEIIQTEIL